MLESQNVGPHFETWNAGVLGPITLNGLDEGRRDLSWQKWSYKVLPQTFAVLLFSSTLLDFAGNSFELPFYLGWSQW